MIVIHALVNVERILPTERSTSCQESGMHNLRIFLIDISLSKKKRAGLIDCIERIEKYLEKGYQFYMTTKKGYWKIEITE
jgi:hypothetical protein